MKFSLFISHIWFTIRVSFRIDALHSGCWRWRRASLILTIGCLSGHERRICPLPKLKTTLKDPLLFWKCSIESWLCFSYTFSSKTYIRFLDSALSEIEKTPQKWYYKNNGGAYLLRFALIASRTIWNVKLGLPETCERMYVFHLRHWVLLILVKCPLF